MTPASFASWRARLGFTKADAARRLGLSRNSVQAYEEGTSPIPLHVALACAAIAHGLPPIE